MMPFYDEGFVQLGSGMCTLAGCRDIVFVLGMSRDEQCCQEWMTKLENKTIELGDHNRIDDSSGDSVRIVISPLQFWRE